MPEHKPLDEKTIAAIRARARQLAARIPAPTDEQVRIIGPLLGPRGWRTSNPTGGAR